MIHIPYTHTEGLHFYMIFNLAAILIGIAGAWLVAQKNKFQFSDFALIVSSGLLMLIIGSKLVLFDKIQWLSLFREGYLSSDHGKSVVGAIVGGMIGAWAVSKFLGNKSSILDLCAVSFPLSLAVQRLGCLFSGCCHGMITSMPWGITYGPGSKPFLEQQELGLISKDAITSLAIHPNQIYNIVACLIIALIAWKTGSRWKSSSGKFLFSVIMYLSFRFLEEFTRFRLHPDAWMGINIIQWKIISIVSTLGLFLFFRERRAITQVEISDAATRLPAHILKQVVVGMMVLTVVFHIGGWLNPDERILILVAIMPLCGIALASLLLRFLILKNYVRTGSLIAFAFVLMSQKSDVPLKTPESYTSFDFQTGLGKFNNEHEFNYREEMGTDCDGYPTVYGITDNVAYKHSYIAGGLGVSRKIYYNQWRSLLTSFHVFAAHETETAMENDIMAPNFKNTLWSINPMLQYDTRGIGLGIGGSFGMLGHDILDDPNDHRDYNPKHDARTASLQYRLRLFSERYAFIEMSGGYDLGSVGDENAQVLVGSRFNSQKTMMKGGLGWSRHGGRSVILQGEFGITPRLYFSPQLMVYGKDYNANYINKASRVVLGIEYRINDK